METSNFEQWIMPVIVPIVISLLGIWAGRRLQNSQAEKGDADAAAVIKDAALDLLAPLKTQLDELQHKLRNLQLELKDCKDSMRAEVSQAREEIDKLKRQNASLRARIRELEK